jgi:hypothetical protein
MQLKLMNVSVVGGHANWYVPLDLNWRAPLAEICPGEFTTGINQWALFD